MKITDKLMMITFENEVSIANDSIKGTLQHQAYISEDKCGGLTVDIEFTDIHNMHFLGNKLPEGYDNWKIFKKTMMDLGVDVDKMLDEASDKLVTDDLKCMLKREYRSTNLNTIK